MEKMTDQEVKSDPSSQPETEDDEEKMAAFHQSLNTPAYMKPLMRRQLLRQMVKALPEPVQRRVNALKNLQLANLKLEAKFYEEIYQLERKYLNLYQPSHDKRSSIVSGEYEPTEKESEWTELTNEADYPEELMTERMKEISLELKSVKPKYDDDVKGIPDFWYVIFKSTELLSDMVQVHDEPVIKKLYDIKILYAEDHMAYTLEFHFLPNDYFTNTVLTKQYLLKSKIDGEEPFMFEGPEIYKSIGCDIAWKKNMNLTIKIIKKKQKHKARGAVRTVTKHVPNDSFFNFFSPPEVQVDNDDELDADTKTILATDFEIGHFLRERIIPRAALYYTGDVLDLNDDDDLEEEEEESEIDDDSEEDEEDDDDEAGPVAPKANKGKKNANAAQNTPVECQQQ